MPEGTFDTRPEDIEDRYCDNPNRRKIWDKFIDFCHRELSHINSPKVIYIDGGFTSDKPYTKDIDIILDVSDLDDSSLLKTVMWQQGNHSIFASTYQVDFWLYHPMFPKNLCSFFEYIKEAERIERGAAPGAKKGLLRISL